MKITESVKGGARGGAGGGARGGARGGVEAKTKYFAGSLPSLPLTHLWTSSRTASTPPSSHLRAGPRWLQTFSPADSLCCRGCYQLAR